MVLVESVELVELVELVGLVELEVLAELEVPVESGATGHRSGSTTRSTAAERLMEIELRPTGSVV